MIVLSRKGRPGLYGDHSSMDDGVKRTSISMEDVVNHGISYVGGLGNSECDSITVSSYGADIESNTLSLRGHGESRSL